MDAQADLPPHGRGWPYFAANAVLPPNTAVTGLASFVVRGFDSGAWRSPASACWLVEDNPDEPWVEAGSVIVVAEGPTPVAFFMVQKVIR